MSKGILIGNGLNIRIGIDSFSSEQIWKRFIENIRRYKPILEASFDISFCEKELIDLLMESNNKGIEVLAGIVYKYIYEIIGDDWCVNYEMHLQDLLTVIAITTIFLDETGKRKVTYCRECLPDFSVYDFVFTLNYYEFWDNKHITRALHGRVDLEKIFDSTNMLVSSRLMGSESYKKAVEDIAKNYRVQIVNLGKVIFAPAEMDKGSLICVTGLCPSNRLFPAYDLYPIEKRQLYGDLSEVEELDILGMSPYGDDSIIDVINTKQKVKVFVYNKDTNVESKEWAKKLTGSFEIIDSSLI